METVNYLIKAFLLIGLIPIVLSLPPSYSSQYSKVRYQPHQNANKGKLELEETSREEVTENTSRSLRPPSSNPNLPPSSREVFELTTEKESEQINFARFTHSKTKLADKLRENVTPRFLDYDVYTSTIKNDYTSTDVNTEVTTEQLNDKEYLGNIQNDYESTTSDNTNITTEVMSTTDISPTTEQISDKENIKSEDAELIENIENFDVSMESEVDDLNEQGVYYIIHPNGLFQKVVYKTLGEPLNASNNAVQYENIKPIDEPSYSYDPQTFVLQRLLFQLPMYI